MKKLLVTSITCVHTSNNAGINLGLGDDDVYLYHQSDGGVPLRYPTSGVIKMNDDDKAVHTISPPLAIYYAYGCYVALFDKDSPTGHINASDLLGNTGVKTDGEWYPSDLHVNNGAHYKLELTIEDA